VIPSVAIEGTETRAEAVIDIYDSFRSVSDPILYYK
jgi:hypothetical protein